MECSPNPVDDRPKERRDGFTVLELDRATLEKRKVYHPMLSASFFGDSSLKPGLMPCRCPCPPVNTGIAPKSRSPRICMSNSKRPSSFVGRMEGRRLGAIAVGRRSADRHRPPSSLASIIFAGRGRGWGCFVSALFASGYIPMSSRRRGSAAPDFP